MADGKKTYYQVSFTGGQALAAVVSIVVALGLSFFFGAKAGFERTAEPGAAPNARPAPVGAAAPAPAETSATEAASPTPSAVAASEEAPVFEDREPGVAESKTPPAAGEASRAPSRTEISGAPKTAATKPGASHPAAPTASSELPTSAAPAKDAQARAAREPARTAGGEPAQKTAPARAGGYFVQVLSTSSKAEARRWKEKLEAKSYRTAAVSSVESKKGTLFRVRLGPYPDRAQAKKAAAKISSEFKQKAWVAPE